MSEYTSNMLCHFVGRSKPNDDARFDLLVTIIRGNKLIANLEKPSDPESRFVNGYRCEHAGEVFGKCDCVCFCDIPDNALNIHISKYGKFGIGFKKEYIAQQGAHPVMYVPLNYPIKERGDNSAAGGKSQTPREPNLYFPYLLNLSVHLLKLMALSLPFTNMQSVQKFYDEYGLSKYFGCFDKDVRNKLFSGKWNPIIYSLLQGWATQMAYVKLYDVTLPDDDPYNYYMEREWRSLDNIEFTLTDIQKVYLPNESYKDKFIEEFPDYAGEFWLFDTQ